MTIQMTTPWFSPKLPVCTSPAALQGCQSCIVCIATASRHWLRNKTCKSTPFAVESANTFSARTCPGIQDYLFCGRPSLGQTTRQNERKDTSRRYRDKNTTQKPTNQRQPHSVSNNTEISCENGLSQNLLHFGVSPALHLSFKTIVPISRPEFSHHFRSL